MNFLILIMHHIGQPSMISLENQLNVKIYYFNNIFISFKQTVNKYLLKSNNNIFLTDTSLIANKCGFDKKSYNPQLTKHKSTKISSINDIKGMPLDIDIYSSNINDSKILNLHIDNTDFFNTNNNNILLGDAGYDSNIIRNKLQKMKFGKLITPKNNRNCKNPVILKKNKYYSACFASHVGFHPEASY